jgi:gas vesicle protein
MEAEMLDTRGTLTLIAVALVAGGAGLLAGMMIAPSSGRETRRMWRRRAEEEAGAVERKARRAAEDVSRDAKRYLEDQLAHGKEVLSRIAGREA